MLKKKKQQNSLVVFPHPIWKICSSKWVHFPQFLGWSWKIFELPPPRRLFWTETWHLSQVGHVSPTWTTTEIAWEISQNKRSGRIKRSLTWYVVLFQIVLDKQTKKKMDCFYLLPSIYEIFSWMYLPSHPRMIHVANETFDFGIPQAVRRGVPAGQPPHAAFRLQNLGQTPPESRVVQLKKWISSHKQLR